MPNPGLESSTNCDNGVAYTSSGNTVGECKLFAMLHALKLIKDDALAGFPKVETFYSHFAAMPASKAVLDDGSKFPSGFLPVSYTHLTLPTILLV